MGYKVCMPTDFLNFQADIILWDYAEKKEYARFVLHNVKVQGLVFSPNSLYLVSIGGQDDGRYVEKIT